MEISLFPLLGIVLVLFILWICTLVYQGKRKQWGWFILTIIFNIVWVIYWIVWLFSSKLKRKPRR